MKGKNKGTLLRLKTRVFRQSEAKISFGRTDENVYQNVGREESGVCVSS